MVFYMVSCVIITLFNTVLCRSAFSTISFQKLVFRLSVLFVSFVSSKVFLTRRLLLKKLLLKLWQYSQESNCVGVSI